MRGIRLSLVCIMVLAMTFSALASTTVLERTVPYTNLAKGQYYYYETLIPMGNYSDPDLEQLTDGLFAWSWATMVGWHRPEVPIEILVDLGRVRQNVVGASVIFMFAESSAVVMPQEVRIYVSQDGKEFRPMGEATTWYPKTPVTGALYELYLEFDPVAARYVMFEVTGDPSKWVLIPELMVWGK